MMLLTSWSCWLGSAQIIFKLRSFHSYLLLIDRSYTIGPKSKNDDDDAAANIVYNNMFGLCAQLLLPELANIVFIVYID